MENSVVVLGGAGRFGSRVCEALAAGGVRPIAFDDLSKGSGDRVQWGPLVKVDARETPRLVRTLNEYKSREVVHCALRSDVEDPAVFYPQHLETVMSSLKALVEIGGGSLTLVTEKLTDQSMLERIANDTAKATGIKVRFLNGLSDEEVLGQLRSPHD